MQVTNTVANPAIAQSPNTQAGQLVYLEVSVYGGAVDFYGLLANGATSFPYQVPANQTLVVTSADLTPSNCAAPVQVILGSISAPPYALQYWTVSGSTTLHFDYPAGIPLASSSQPFLNSVNASLVCGVQVQLRGYLTAN